EQSGPPPAGSVEPAGALAAIGIDLESIRRNAEETFGPGALRFPRIPFSPAAKRTMELSLHEALILSSFYIGPEHLLLGLLAEGGRAVEVLAALGVDPDELRAEIVSRAAPAAERVQVANAEIGRLGAKLASLDDPSRPEIADALHRLRLDAGAAYENAAGQSRHIQEHLADQLEQVLAAATADYQTAGTTIPTVTETSAS
ncbi:MAG: Clp protease N-terminal domain-containing protein, partial [Acidimicrobiales bacterium]